MEFLEKRKKLIYLLIINNFLLISSLIIYFKLNLDKRYNLFNNQLIGNQDSNVSIGKESLFVLNKSCDGGLWNIAIGPDTQHSLCNAEQNTAIGRAAQYVLTKGAGNIAIGATSQRNLKEGSYNIGLGTDTMYNSEIAYHNIAIGYDALHDNIRGNDNVSIGYWSGYDSPKSKINSKYVNRNVWIGNFTGKSVTENINDSIAIGYKAKNDKSNQVVIGNENIKETNLYGVVSVERLILRVLII